MYSRQQWLGVYRLVENILQFDSQELKNKYIIYAEKWWNKQQRVRKKRDHQ